MIIIEVDDARVKAALADLARKVADPRPALQRIGEFMVETTKQRFDTSTAPDGSHWQANSALTILRSRHGAAKKPLVERGNLRDSIRYQVDETGLTIGTNWMAEDIKGGAAIHQLGGQAGRGHKATIPPRPFLGVSEADRAMIERTVLSYLQPKG